MSVHINNAIRKSLIVGLFCSISARGALLIVRISSSVIPLTTNGSNERTALMTIFLSSCVHNHAPFVSRNAIVSLSINCVSVGLKSLSINQVCDSLYMRCASIANHFLAVASVITNASLFDTNCATVGSVT